jgi:poly-beta-1,6-N-acetyl-D-glucosamine synthase
MNESIVGSLVVALVIGAASVGQVLLDFVYFYPLFMSWIWIAGGLYFYFHWERHNGGPDTMPSLPDSAPKVSILVPCFNEGENVIETIAALVLQNYPNFEIVAINDGSTDRTGEILNELTAQYPNLRVVHHATNQGKAMGLRMGALVARGEYLVCIDADAVLHANAIAHLVAPLLRHPRVGAVTGNPRIRNRSTLLGRIQVGEFSSIIGLIKRAQRIYGNVFTVSGVIAAFRRAALNRIGYWSVDMVTEDIDVSWALELDHWSIQYQPNAVCWILMPETFRGLWKQRLRWAQGGAEVFLKHIKHIWTWRQRRMWMLMSEYIVSVAWAFAWTFSILLWVLGRFVALPGGLNVPTIFPPVYWGLMLATTCLAQFAMALWIESRYEPHLLRSLYWIIWYPTIFWFISLVTAEVGFPRALFKRRGRRAVWTSPDRGFRSFKLPT